jgi:Na+/phosphate symporter
MKPIITILISICFLSSAAYSQTSSYKRTIEINDGESPSVTITTVENGKTTIEELKGEEAKRYIKKQESDKLVNLEITKNDINELEQDLQKFMLKVESRIIEINEEPMDTTIQRFNRNIEKTSNCIKREICGAI